MINCEDDLAQNSRKATLLTNTQRWLIMIMIKILVRKSEEKRRKTIFSSVKSTMKNVRKKV